MSKEFKKEDFWSCERCGIDSNTKGKMIPCPRGFCDAEITGAITTITETIIFPKEKPKSFSEEWYDVKFGNKLRPICSCGLGEKVDGENYCRTCLNSNPLFIA